MLLRVVHRGDPGYRTVRTAVGALRRRGDDLCAFPQNVAEFWNASTRPATARGGFGLTVEQAARRLRRIDRLVTILPDDPAGYPEWLGLVLTHGVMGVQVYDARIAAAMRVHGVTHILTGNAAHFRRYPGLTVLTPDEVAAGARGG